MPGGSAIETVLLLVAVVVVSVSLGALAWRSVSRRQSRPCPAWMVPLLENPYVESLAGAETLIRRAAVMPGMAVLDVGCGPGRLTLPLARAVGPQGRVVAIDMQPRMLARLDRRRRASGIENVEVLLLGAGEGKLAAGGFDRAFLVTVLGEIVNKRRALSEVYAALAPGGLLSITELVPDPHYQRRQRVMELAQSSGFCFEQGFGSWLAFTLNFRKQRRIPE